MYYIYTFRFFGPTEVSLTKLRAHSKTALLKQEDYDA